MLLDVAISGEKRSIDSASDIGGDMFLNSCAGHTDFHHYTSVYNVHYIIF